MPDINDIYPASGNFMKSSDIKTGELLDCEVAKVEVKPIKDQKPKVVLTLTSGKEFPLNVTNAKALAVKAGTSDYTKWIGLKFKVVRMTTLFQGSTVDCLRVV